MLSWRSGKARIWGTEGPRFEPHSSHPSEVPAAVDPWANRGSLKDAGIAQIRAVSRGGHDLGWNQHNQFCSIWLSWLSLTRH
ncbi:hypothetical protein E3N88_23153 [Mikania micrantha]|uniref:Uncharacterized protein n=1 Tax=Mikania micrantha TaxID=192012 RepID=A0A5N6NCI2_9ASTR|nr:hypothetical protein E3N88_23153 [Mikania micrantha]